VKHDPVARFAAAAVALERITRLAEQLARTPAGGLQRTLKAALRSEAGAYRKALDAEQATAAHDARPIALVHLDWPVPRPRKPVFVDRAAIDRRCPTSRFGRAAVPVCSWLFIRAEESIRIERPSKCSMDVAGPGADREHLDFTTERALRAYQAATAERLRRGGWFPARSAQERRSHGERRAPSAGHRQPPPA
jgi:hypothetical protein